MTDQDISVLLEAFAACQVANVSDNLERMAGAKGMMPYYKGERMSGRAFTVRTAPGDNASIHEALDLFIPGDVIVVDGGGYLDRALIGEIMARLAESRGAAGIVIDGAIRDSDELKIRSFPVFARGVTHLGPYKNGPGAIGVPVSIGGLVIKPGDIVLGDGDGITAFSPEIGPALLDATLRQQKKESDILASIADGTYKGAYKR